MLEGHRGLWEPCLSLRAGDPPGASLLLRQSLDICLKYWHQGAGGQYTPVLVLLEMESCPIWRIFEFD